MAIAPFAPGIELYKQFARSATVRTARQSAYVFGPAAKVARYTEPTERAGTAIGQFSNSGSLIDGNEQNAYAWPEKPLGSELDADFTQLHIERGFLEYWASGDSEFDAPSRSELRSDTRSFSPNGSFGSDAVFGEGGVRVGDRVLITGLADGEPFSLFTYVRGFKGDLSTPSLGAAIAGDNNAEVAVAAYTATPGAPSDVELETTGQTGKYNGLASGRLTETYRVTVTQASTGGDLTTARLSVVSGSGTDNHYNVIPAAYDAEISVGPRELPIKFTHEEVSDPDLELGQYWDITVTQAYSLPVATVSGSYTATDYRDRHYLIQVVQGGEMDDSPVVRVTELGGTDAPANHTLSVATGTASVPFAVGSYGTLLSFDASAGLVYGDRWVVTVTAAKPEHMRTLLLAHPLPVGVDEDAVDNEISVRLFVPYAGEIPRKSHLPGEFNFTAKETGIDVRTDISLAPPGREFPGQSTLPLVHVDAMGSDASQLFATHRLWYARSTRLLSIADPAELSTLVGGPVDADNPLKYALSKALIANDGVPVFFFNIGNPDRVDNWIKALDAADNSTLVYGFVPLTTDNTVLDLVAGHVTTRSGPLYNLYRCAWYTNNLQDTGAIADASNSTDGNPLMATILDDPQQGGTQYTLLSLTSGNFEFMASGVRAGDRVRIAYAVDAWGEETFDEYVIDAVLSEATLRLVTGPEFPEGTPRRIELWRTMTTQEKAAAYASRIENKFSPSSDAGQVDSSGRYPGYLFRYMPFGFVADGAQVVPSYHMLAYLAAARSALAPHQPMTRLTVSGFSEVIGVDLFSTTELNEIAASGGFIVHTDIATGNLVVRHAVTAGDWNNVNTREESIISNVDSINAAFVHALAPYIGKANITDQSLAMMRAEIESLKSELLSPSAGPLVGPQVLDLTIVELRRSPSAKDAVLLRVEYLVPGPMNKIIMNVLIS